ncbi:DUF1120 domain-containing protein [Pseudomonas poae]|uniref:DUF1120 domain-containing protein n=1 Tax=Pseudomonas poae TaxID=200451 RepID=A0A2S9EVN6_9PSED|nr:DUF1120 domain-containing protein [Pseudomonas poae]PRA28751.1 hypothetical protein CQZ97_14050 [Pseudomonas poae]PRC20448.1 hypothetical protein CQZ99_07295 [Pseudomonas poae]
MKTFIRLCATLLLLPFNAMAAASVELTVAGKITPDACHVILGDEGTIDHGKIAVHHLDLDEFTPLPSRSLALSIQCSRPMLFALVGIDDRANSSHAPGFFYGLGTNVHAPEERLGAVALTFENPMGDNQPMQALASGDKGETWKAQAAAAPGLYMGFALPGDRQPDFIGQLHTQLRIDTSINARRALTLGNEVPLDGAIVLDLRYL